MSPHHRLSSFSARKLPEAPPLQHEVLSSLIVTTGVSGPHHPWPLHLALDPWTPQPVAGRSLSTHRCLLPGSPVWPSRFAQFGFESLCGRPSLSSQPLLQPKPSWKGQDKQGSVGGGPTPPTRHHVLLLLGPQSLTPFLMEPWDLLSCLPL